MGKWKQGAYFDLGKGFVNILMTPDSRGCFHIVGRETNGNLWHFVRGSKSPFPIDDGRIISTEANGIGDMFISKTHGNIEVAYPSGSGFRTWYSNPLEFPDPSGDIVIPPPPPPPPPEDKKLSIEGRDILYGGEPIKLCGVSRWEALWREYGEHKWHNWGEYSLEWYEQQLINSGINYVRHGGIMDSSLLYEHCKRMKDARIIVEVSVYRVAETEGVLVELDRMGELADLGNVFFDVCNEFIGTNEGEVNTVFNIATQLRDNGCLVSGGAWSGDGQVLADEFLEIFDVDIVTHHRDWTSQSFGDTLSYMKPVVWNEYFAMREQLPIEEIERRMDMAFDVGINGVQYYGFRFSGLPGLTNIDPWQSDEFNDEMLTYAGKQ